MAYDHFKGNRWITNLRNISLSLPIPKLYGWNASSSHGYPSTFHEASLKIRRYPFAFWVERCTVRVKNLAHEQNALTWPGIEPRPLDRDSSVLTIRRLVHSVSHIVWVVFLKKNSVNLGKNLSTKIENSNKICQYVIFGTHTHRMLSDADFIREIREHKYVSDIKNATIKPLI